MPPRKSLEKLVKNCLHCKKLFVPKRPKQIFCCDKHRVYHGRAQKKEKEQKFEELVTETLNANEGQRRQFNEDLIHFGRVITKTDNNSQTTVIDPCSAEGQEVIELATSIEVYDGEPLPQSYNGDEPGFYGKIIQQMEQPQEPADLTGLDLLAWRNEHRKNNPNE